VFASVDGAHGGHDLVHGIQRSIQHTALLTHEDLDGLVEVAQLILQAAAGLASVLEGAIHAALDLGSILHAFVLALLLHSEFPESMDDLSFVVGERLDDVGDTIEVDHHHLHVLGSDGTGKRLQRTQQPVAFREQQVRIVDEDGDVHRLGLLAGNSSRPRGVDGSFNVRGATGDGRRCKRREGYDRDLLTVLRNSEVVAHQPGDRLILGVAHTHGQVGERGLLWVRRGQAAHHLAFGGRGGVIAHRNDEPHQEAENDEGPAMVHGLFTSAPDSTNDPMRPTLKCGVARGSSCPALPARWRQSSRRVRSCSA